MRNPVSFQTQVEDLALVTFQVPAIRVRPHLPSFLELETFGDPDGSHETAFVSTAVFFNRHFHWTPVPALRLNFWQSTYRTYVRHGGIHGCYYFGTCVGTLSSFLLERGVAGRVYTGEFKPSVQRDDHGYAHYGCEVFSRMGELWLELVAPYSTPEARPPFATGSKLAQFLTYRFHGYLDSTAGFLLDQRIEHRPLTPWAGRLLNGRFEFWERLGILTPAEAFHPYSVLVNPTARFEILPPIPALFARSA